MCIGCFTCIYVCVPRVQGGQNGGGGQPTETEVTGGPELPFGCLELNMDLIEEHMVLSQLSYLPRPLRQGLKPVLIYTGSLKQVRGQEIIDYNK